MICIFFSIVIYCIDKVHLQNVNIGLRPTFSVACIFETSKKIEASNYTFHQYQMLGLRVPGLRSLAQSFARRAYSTPKPVSKGQEGTYTYFTITFSITNL